MNFFTKFLNSFFKEDKSWAVRFMAIEYQKDFANMRKMGVNVTPEIALDYLTAMEYNNVK